MKKILILGIGRSSSALLGYLEENSQKYNWEITVGVRDVEAGRKKVSPSTRVVAFDVFNEQQLNTEVQAADVVVSMVPARFHPMVAMVCLKYSKSMLTASYESDEIAEMAARAKSQGILFLNELGVDPGIDHMSAMRAINHIREQGHRLLCFESFTGGLIAPESDTNPWNYKITWNPRNVVLAGQGGPARFIQEGTYKYIPYNRVFRRTEVRHGLNPHEPLDTISGDGLEDIPQGESLSVFMASQRRGTLDCPSGHGETVGNDPEPCGHPPERTAVKRIQDHKDRPPHRAEGEEPMEQGRCRSGPVGTGVPGGPDLGRG